MPQIALAVIYIIEFSCVRYIIVICLKATRKLLEFSPWIFAFSKSIISSFFFACLFHHEPVHVLLRNTLWPKSLVHSSSLFIALWQRLSLNLPQLCVLQLAANSAGCFRASQRGTHCIKAKHLVSNRQWPFKLLHSLGHFYPSFSGKTSQTLCHIFFHCSQKVIFSRKMEAIRLQSLIFPFPNLHLCSCI